MSVLLGNGVKALLEVSSAVTDIVGTKIYPVVALQGVPSFPFVVYNVQVTGASYGKGMEGLGHVQDECQVMVNCVAKTYDESVALQAAVRSALECKAVDDAMQLGFTADPMTVSHADCAFDKDAMAFDSEIQFATFTQPMPTE